MKEYGLSFQLSSRFYFLRGGVRLLLLNFTCSSPVKAQSKDVTLSEKIIWALNSFKGDILFAITNGLYLFL